MPDPERNETSLFQRIITRLRKRRFAYLMKSLLLLLLAYPYLEQDAIGQALMNLITIVVMITLIVAVGERKRNLIIGILLAVPWFLSIVINFPLIEKGQGILIRKEIVFAMLLFFYTTINIFIHLIRSREITSEILFAALCVYLLLGLSWASLYVCIDILNPGSFVDVAGANVTEPPKFLFFSYVTLSTVGYGNVVPATDQVRSLAMLEAVVGQLYLTILVARLVGLHISKPKAMEDKI